MIVHTSHTRPIRLDTIPPALLPTPGRVGMTFAPGKKGAGLHFEWNRDLEADFTRLRDVYGISAIVNLIEDHEFKLLGIEDYEAALARVGGMKLKRFPIVDGGVPQHGDDFRRLIGWILDRLGLGAHVAVHCRGGLGRAGMVTASVLVSLGVDAEIAIREVRVARPGTVETEAQESYVHQFNKYSIAKRSNWKNLQPMKESRARLESDARFSMGDYYRLRLGFVPRDMDDKWYLYFENDCIFIHRSWTGKCVYQARLARAGGGDAVIAEAYVQLDERPGPYHLEEEAARMIELIRGYMLPKLG